LHLLARNDFKKYFVAFVAAALIKETALFLTLFFILQFGKIGTKKFILLVLAQLLVYAVIRAGIMLAFKDNPGTVMEYHLYDHAAAYRQRPIAATGLLCAIIAVGAGAAYLRKRYPFISNSLIAIGGTTTVLYLFFGVPFEIRVFLETYPSIFLTVVLSAVSCLVQFKDREIIRQVSR
jgi:hypothetical protein